MSEERKKSPNLSLRGAVGQYLIGKIEKRFESKTYPGVYSSLITVEETDGSTTLWDGEKEVEADISEGDTVFLKETKWLNRFMEENIGNRVKITYVGTKKSDVKGRRPTFTYDMKVLGENS